MARQKQYHSPLQGSINKLIRRSRNRYGAKQAGAQRFGMGNVMAGETAVLRFRKRAAAKLKSTRRASRKVYDNFGALLTTNQWAKQGFMSQRRKSLAHSLRLKRRNRGRKVETVTFAQLGQYAMRPGQNRAANPARGLVRSKARTARQRAQSRVNGAKSRGGSRGRRR